MWDQTSFSFCRALSMASRFFNFSFSLRFCSSLRLSASAAVALGAALGSALGTRGLASGCAGCAKSSSLALLSRRKRVLAKASLGWRSG